MNRARHLLYSLRVARPRQLKARALRPLRRRSFPISARAVRFSPLPGGLWRSTAFSGADEVVADGVVRVLGKELRFPPSDWDLPGEPRLRRFHLHYGEEVLGWTRTGELEAADSALRAWIAGNPPRLGDAWHPYPLSTRVGNWIAALSLAPELATPTTLESLDRQLAHLKRNVEDDVLGNHVIRNARALVLGGAALGRRELLDRGVALLRRELPEQVLPDGGHYERSPVYHLVVLRDLMELRVVGLDWLDDTVERMRRFAAALSRPDGRPALFNDGLLDLAPTLELPAPDAGLAVFRETGYVVVRSERLWLAVDCGPPGPAFLPAHAHADALSLQLWWDRHPVLVDSGSFTYDPGPERTRLRSTRAHSTIELDGASQFETWRAFRSGPFPEVRLDRVDGAGLEAHVVWPGGVVHRRRVEWGAEEVTIRDRVEGAGRHRVASRLVLAPGSGTAGIEAVEGAHTSVEAGWVSERFGERIATDVLVAGHDGGLPVELGWRIGDLQ
jgi:Heparinase II/III-like protein/Heparinase II/III N-terminus